MLDLTPQFPILSFEQEVFVQGDFSETFGPVVGGFQAAPGELRQGKVAIQGLQERILIGDATAPLTGIGIYIGNDGATSTGYDFRAGNPSGNYIHWDASAATLTISGSITATSGTIGGFNIGTDYIRDVADSFGLASTVSGSDDVRFWAGATFANRATAPFRVTEAGAVTGSNFTHSGGSVTGVPISSIPNNSSTDISLLEKTWTMVFSVTDLNTIAWGSGTITLSNGRTFSISAGNTGNMAALTYVYLDPAVSTTVLQTTTTAATALGANKILVGVAQNNTVTANWIPYGPGQMLVDGAQIGALSIVAGNIAASTITAGKMSVSQLSAIAADLGSITAGTIVLPSGGFVRSGQTAYNTGTGWYIGNDSGTTKFSIGVGGSVTQSLTWDGSTLTVNGYVIKGAGSFGGDGSDGALSITSGTTTTSLASANVYIKNYSSISITGTGKQAFSSPATTGSVVIWKSSGNVTLTSSQAPMLDLASMGATGGAGGSGSSNAPGTNGTGGFMPLGFETAGGSGSDGGTGNGSFTISDALAIRAIRVACGAGGTGGTAEQSGTPDAGGAGGRGGGGLYIECAGAFNFTTASGISVAGAAGTAGAGGSAGGGGGAGGTCIILYRTLTANSGTVTISGGAGGNGSTGTAGVGGTGGAGGNGTGGNANGGTGGRPETVGGGGGAGDVGGANGSNGTVATSSSSGSGGGGGASGSQLIASNIYI